MFNESSKRALGKDKIIISITFTEQLVLVSGSRSDS